MKKIILLLFFVFNLNLLTKAQVSVPQNYASYLGVLDTLTNADATSYTTTVVGAKREMSWQVKVLKISGTVAGTIKVHGSVDGVDFGSTALDSITLADASSVYWIHRTSSGFQKFRITVATTGTSSASQRTYLLYRQ